MNGWEVPEQSWHKGFSRNRGWFIAAALCFIPLYAYGQVAEPMPERVVIDSAWGGFNPEMPFNTHIVIEKNGASYRLTGWHSKSRYGKPLPKQVFPAQTISPERVTELVGAMEAPVQSRVDLRTLEPAVNDAQHEIDGILEQAKLPTSSTGLGANVRAWRGSLRSPGALADALTRGFDAIHTDDSPVIDIQVTLSDGTKLSAKSSSQHYLMLPWKDALGNRTYSTNIPRALDALLPKGTTNKERLEGGLEGSDLEDMLEFGLNDQIGRFDAESEVPDAVRLLDANFKVVGIWPGRQLDADLQLPDGPSNLQLSTRLSLSGKTLANAADVVRIRQMLQLVQSSPVLGAHIKSSPNVEFYIHDNVGWTWLNKKTVSQFVSQMQQMKKLPELQTRPALMQGAVLVEEGEWPIYWVVLSDRRAVLWKQASQASDKPFAGSCPAIPMGDGDVTGIYDTCIGKVYGVDGREQ
ncbi:hypothetical protein [Dyella mobilis]|uniref:Uncharacterized protein n=1 Tax=Dyella mobilis TaxID=1849582 RepID=A0ABS2KCD0_9GAMM|nr:hypothetical protein [Dyella mobilis]MBM7128822.1 hypothetical protein [Dyella mobilis]GLQ99154.1 hypothetical protein GCM10007863_35740 [Dyella mobilis]